MKRLREILRGSFSNYFCVNVVVDGLRLRRHIPKMPAEKNVSIFISSDKRPDVQNIAEEIMSTGIKSADAAHIACAILAECDYFLTTDDRVLKYRNDKIKILNPVEFLKILEVTDNVQHD